MIEKDTEIKCPSCKRLSKIQMWNSLSLAACKSAEMRKLYMPLYDERAFEKDNYYYVCPLCGIWSAGEKLIITEEVK